MTGGSKQADLSGRFQDDETSSSDSEGFEEGLMANRARAEKKSVPLSKETIPYEQLQAAGFQGGPSLMEASQEIARAREERKEEERAAAAEAAQKLKEEEAAEEATRQKRSLMKQQSPAENMALKDRIVTQAERRGTALRSQAAADMDYKYSIGQAMDVSLYSGAAKKEVERRHQLAGGKRTRDA